MADEQYKWLDREAAERLLRGEPLEAVAADDRAAADRLTGALAALTGPASDGPSMDGELPGEEAALAAFRKARAEQDSEDAALSGRSGTRSAAPSADAGLVRLGRPGTECGRIRWGRPVRFGLTAALAAGMLGGVAVAAGTGVLPTPFRHDRPEPASSVSAPAPPERPLTSPSPEGTANAPAGRPSPGGNSGTSDDAGSREDSVRGGGTGEQPGSTDPGSGRPGTGHGRRGAVLAACRDALAGKNLDSDRRHGLEGAAGGKDKVRKYCEGILNGQSDRSTEGTSNDAPDSGDSKGDGPGRGQGGQGQGQGKSNGNGGRGKGGDGANSRSGGSNHRGNGGFTGSLSTHHLLDPAPDTSPAPTFGVPGALATR